MSYFMEKDPHSEIKHTLYTKTLETSLSIANVFNKGGAYTIVDLYAGQGRFDDGSKGSPILALETCLKVRKEIKNMPVNFVFVEKNEESYARLGYELKAYLEGRELCSKIKIYQESGEWVGFREEIRQIMENGDWGFMFADPFANEIDMQKISDLLEKNYTKDVMIFINLSAIKRMAGNKMTRKKIADFLKISENDLAIILDSSRYEELLMDSIQDVFKLNKHYNLFASIPTTRKNKLIHSNNFCLLCATNSIGVADSFLNTYADLLHINKTIQPGLFAEVEIEKRIQEFLQNYGGEASLHEILAYAMGQFLSWRDHEPKEVPTSSNVIKVINGMYDRKLIDWEANERFVSNRNNTRHLKIEICRRNDSMRATQIFWLPA